MFASAATTPINSGVCNTSKFVCPAGRAYFCATKVAKTWGMISIPPPYPLNDQGSALDPRSPMGETTRYIPNLITVQGLRFQKQNMRKRKKTEQATLVPLW